MKQSRRNRKQQQLLKELENNPFIEQACKKIGIARSTYYRWIEQDNSFAQLAEHSQQHGRTKVNDFAESKLLENVRNNHYHSIAFWLRHNHQTYRSEGNRNWLDIITMLQEYDRVFEYAITFLGQEKARQAFGYSTAEDLENAAREKAKTKQADKLRRKV